MKFFVTFLIFLISLVESKYEIYLDRVENSENNTIIEHEYLRVRKFNRSA